MKTCLVCEAPFQPTTKGRHQLYCSARCKRRNYRFGKTSHPKKVRLMISTCAHCGVGVRGRPASKPTIRYCSPTCAEAAAQPTKPRSVPTREPACVYVAACLSCGREQGEPVRLTRRQSVLVARVGLPRCTTCHGCVLIEDHSVGSIGSPQYGYSASYASLARAWGKGAA